MKIKVSVVIPVKNEEAHIEALLCSLREQTYKPNEIVIVDGGSKDRTVSLVEQHMNNLPIKIIKTNGALPGKGRNLGITHANYDTIAMTDGGVVLDPHWLEYLIQPFIQHPDIEVVCGNRDTRALTIFEQCVYFLCLRSRNPGFKDGPMSTPAVSSLAIKRQVWERIGGFREDLRWWEDYIFLAKIARMKFRYAIAPQAMIYWRPWRNPKELFNLARTHSKCQAKLEVRLAPFLKRLFLYTVGMLIFVYGAVDFRGWYLLAILLFLFVIRVGNRYPSRFMKLIIHEPVSLLVLAGVIIIFDAGALLGYMEGVINKIFEGRDSDAYLFEDPKALSLSSGHSQ